MNPTVNYPTRGTTGRGAHSGYETLAKGLGWFSIGLGLAELVAPQALCRALGLQGRETLIQAYGAREIATGVAVLMSHDPTPWIWGRVGGDAVDLVTLATGFREGNRNEGNLNLAIAAVASVTVLDIVCAQGLTADKRLMFSGSFDYSARSGFQGPVAAMRGVASDFVVPPDFRVPEPLRPWTSSGQTFAPASARPVEMAAVI